MHNEIHPADWTIPYSTDLDAQSVPLVLWRLTKVGHDLTAVPWHLVGRMIHLLEAPEASFDYLHVTSFFRARAAMLALKGDVLNHSELHTTMSRHQVQVGGIYRHHLVCHIRAFLKKHNLVQLPECNTYAFDPTHDPKLAEMNRDVLRRLIQGAEYIYLNTLNFLSESPDLTEEIAGQSVQCLALGVGKPSGIPVGVRVKRHRGGHVVMPSREEAKRNSRAMRLSQMYTVSDQEEFGFEKDENTKTDNRGQRTATSGTGDMVDSKEPVGSGQTSAKSDPKRPQAKVIGDFKIIILPNGQKAITLATKHKTRAFLRFIHRRLTESGTMDFYVEEMREAFNAQFTGDMAHKQWQSDRIREDLFRGMEREFDQLFEPLDKVAGHYRLSVAFLTAENSHSRN